MFTGVSFSTPPNAESCLGTNWDESGLLPPSSRHQGGAHVMLGDGAVRFITNSIDTGDNPINGAVFPFGGSPTGTAGQPSQFGTFGALGTRANKEKIGEF